MADPTSPAAIASRLTPRQREALLWLPGDGTSIGCLTFPAGADPTLLQWIVVTDWMRVSLAENRDEILRYRLTPLGRRVRAVVEHCDSVGAECPACGDVVENDREQVRKQCRQ